MYMYIQTQKIYQHQLYIQTQKTTMYTCVNFMCVLINICIEHVIAVPYISCSNTLTTERDMGKTFYTYINNLVLYTCVAMSTRVIGSCKLNLYVHVCSHLSGHSHAKPYQFLSTGIIHTCILIGMDSLPVIWLAGLYIHELTYHPWAITHICTSIRLHVHRHVHKNLHNGAK